jgi:flagellar biosynthesis protein FlhB
MSMLDIMKQQCFIILRNERSQIPMNITTFSMLFTFWYLYNALEINTFFLIFLFATSTRSIFFTKWKFKHKRISQNLKEMHKLKLLLLIKRLITVQGNMENGKVVDAFETWRWAIKYWFHEMSCSRKKIH